MHSASTLTEAALLSGTAKKDRAADAKGGLLREIGEFGILVLKDLTSILSMNRDKQKALLAALREIYDGAWTRRVGVDGAREFAWQGKMGLIGGVTSVIDSHHAVMSAMGQRFALYRIPAIDGSAQARRAIEKSGDEQEMRAELTGTVSACFEGLDFASPQDLSSADEEWIIALTTLVARCRGAVDRHGYVRDIELIHDAEAPARLTKMLVQLLRGARLVGVTRQRAKELIIKVGFDCIHPVRRLAVQELLNEQNPLTLAEVAEGSGYPEQTIRRALQDLECHGIVERSGRQSVAERWCVAQHWREQFEIARGPFPKCH
jgi:predicted transcriptional regulator